MSNFKIRQACEANLSYYEHDYSLNCTPLVFNYQLIVSITNFGIKMSVEKFFLSKNVCSALNFSVMKTEQNIA